MYKEFQNLMDRGYVYSRRHTKLPLTLYKYAPTVFYDDLWHVSPTLQYARGIVYDHETWELVQYPFKKVFNPFERSAPQFHPDDRVTMTRKVNGFMAAATLYKGEWLITTTGSFESEMADLAYTWLERQDVLSRFYSAMGMEFCEDHTILFEICDPNDIHVVEEVDGVSLIGIQSKIFPHSRGALRDERVIDRIHEIVFGDEPDLCYRPETIYDIDFKEAMRRIDTWDEDVEGFVIRRDDGAIYKHKTKNYLIRKFLARGKKNLALWTDKQTIRRMVDEEHYDMVDELVDRFSCDEWEAMSEVEKLRVTTSLIHEMCT